MSELHHQPSTRASDADRARAAERLSTALSEGRLDLAEYEQRTRLALAATTLGDLAPITADLPVPTVDRTASKEVAKKKDKKKLLAEWGYWAFGAVVMTSIWGVNSYVDGELKVFWPAAPLTIWGLILLSYVFWGDDD